MRVCHKGYSLYRVPGSSSHVERWCICTPFKAWSLVYTFHFLRSLLAVERTVIIFQAAVRQRVHAKEMFAEEVLLQNRSKA